jgi:hypothetical protein
MSNRIKATLGVVLTVLIALVALFLARPVHHAPAPPPSAESAPLRSGVAIRAEIGFRTPDLLAEHYRKHGREFGPINIDEYLVRAQTLRDRPASGDVLEAVRADGVTTRYDRVSGAFLAFNRDGTIRTFFRPNSGEAYYRRQLTRREER